MNSDEFPIPQQNRPTVVDLFSGAGGTGLGFRDAGFRILGAIELNANAAKTYEENLSVGVKKIDVKNLSPVAYRRELNLRLWDLDVLVGCPPCQGFSRMRNKEGAEDDRNDLVLYYLEFVEEFMPRFAVFENVPGLVRTSHGRKFYGELCSGLRKLGYALDEREVDAVDYGVAQHRKRVIVVAGRDGEVPPFPLPTHGRPGTPEVVEGTRRPWRTVWDEIGDGKYPSLSAGENGEQEGRYPNHIAPATGEKVLSFIRKVPKDGGSRTEVPKQFWLQCHLSHDGHKDVYGRIAWDRPSNTITSGCTNPSKGRFVHPEQDRALTPREAAALQGFPDAFVFHGRGLAAQIGNAVPPPLAYAVAQTLMKRLLLDWPMQSMHTHSLTSILHTLDVWGGRSRAKNLAGSRGWAPLHPWRERVKGLANPWSLSLDDS